MPGFEIPEPKLAAIVASVRSLGEWREESPVSLQLRKRRTVSFAALVERKPGDWPTYHGRLGGNRHSPLRQIDTGSLTGLAAKWMFPIPGKGQKYLRAVDLATGAIGSGGQHSRIPRHQEV